MNWILLGGLVAVFIFVFFATKLKQSKFSNDDFPYTKNQTLFSPAERSFLGVLEQAVGDEFSVFGKVRIADVVSVQSTANRSAWKRAFNRISAKHFDYVVCSKSDLSVVCVVELDDKSHQQRKRQERDAFVEGLCRVVSLPFLQIPAQRAYSISEVHLKFAEVTGQHKSSIQVLPNAIPPNLQAKEDIPISVPVQPTAQQASRKNSQLTSAPTVPSCPKCSASMVQREVKTGSKAGQKFWGCSTFPKCRGVTLGI